MQLSNDLSILKEFRSQINQETVVFVRPAAGPLQVLYQSVTKMYIPVKQTTSFRGKLTTRKTGERLSQMR